MFKMGDTVKQLKQERWIELVRECNRSGQSKRDWCKENGIGYSTYMKADVWAVQRAGSIC